MAKKAYSKPMLKSEAFVPQSYVAACGDTNKVYKFICDAGVSFGQYYVIEDTNNNGVLDGSWKFNVLDISWEWSGNDKYRSGYHPCHKTHDASTTDEFINGFMTERNYKGEITSTTKVIIWTDNGTNTHCTTNLNMSSWETAKS